MTQEDKQLVIQDLCARLPYGVKAQYYGSEEEMLTVDTIEAIYTQPSVEIVIGQYGLELDDIKPYLRPMSSMTEEEREFLNRMALENNLKCIEEEDPQKVFLLRVKQDVEELAYLYKHHYDVNGLIPSGHAIEVTDENNPYKD